MKLFTIAAALGFASMAQAGILPNVTTCSGFTSPDNQAVSFRWVRSAQGATTSASEIQVYLQDLSLPKQPNNYLGSLPCVSETSNKETATCVTSSGETYTIDQIRKVGTESSRTCSYTYSTCK